MLDFLHFRDWDTLAYWVTAIATLWLGFIAIISKNEWVNQNNLRKKFELASALLETITHFDNLYNQHIKNKKEINNVDFLSEEFEKIAQKLNQLSYEYNLIEPEIVYSVEYFYELTKKHMDVYFDPIGDGEVGMTASYIWDEWIIAEDKIDEENNKQAREELEKNIKALKDICEEDIKVYYGVKVKK